MSQETLESEAGKPERKFDVQMFLAALILLVPDALALGAFHWYVSP